MSILLHSEIVDNYNQNKIVIEPYNPEQVGPNSYDVRLSNVLRVYKPGTVLDCKKDNPTTTVLIPQEGYVLQPGILYLGSTVEKIGSDYFIPMYEGRSSMARLGLVSHLSAGFGDLAFKSFWTTEITVVHPIRIYSNMRIGQVYFHHVNPEAINDDHTYKGKYLDQVGPQSSKSYLDF